MDETHFVYVYIADPAIWKTKDAGLPQEIYYSVRSIQLHFKGKYKIFVVGDNPRIKNVIHIPATRIKGGRRSKCRDSINKLKIIANTKAIGSIENGVKTDGFVYMYDDILIMRDLELANFKLVVARDHVHNIQEYWSKAHPKPAGEFLSLFVETMGLLQRMKMPSWDYETHTPKYFHKSRILEVIHKFNLSDKEVLFNSVYFNNYHHAPATSLVKNPEIKAEIYRPHKKLMIEKLTSYFSKNKKVNKWFLNYDNKGLNNELQRWIKKNF